MRILVTGAAGFIGSRLTQTLLDQDRKVIALDCFLPDLYPADLKRHRWKNLMAREKSSLVKLEFDLRKDDMSMLNDYPIDSIFEHENSSVYNLFVFIFYHLVFSEREATLCFWSQQQQTFNMGGPIDSAAGISNYRNFKWN